MTSPPPLSDPRLVHDTDNVVVQRFRTLKDLGRARPADWERMRAAQPDAWKDWLPHFEEIARGEKFPENLDAQVLILTFLHHFGPLFLGVVNTNLPSILLRQLGVGEDRLKYLISLGRIRDLRSALKARRPSSTRSTLPEEELFPKTGWLGTYLQYVRESEAPPAWHFWCGVAALGAAARRNLYTDLGEYYLYPNHAIVLIGASALGKGLATAPMSKIMAMLNQYHDEYLIGRYRNLELPGEEPFEDRQVVRVPGRTNAHQLINMLAVPHDRLLATPPGTPPLLTRRKQSVGVLINDELSSLLGKDNFGTDDLIRLLTAYYNCDDVPIEAGTIARGIERPRDVALTILGGSTLEWLNAGITQAAFEGGFMSRVLYVTRPAVGVPFYPDGAPTRDPLTAGALARALLPWSLLSETELEFHGKAVALHRAIREKCQAQIDNPKDVRLVPYYKRKRNHIIKLAQVLTMSDLMGELGLDITAEEIEAYGTSLPIFEDVLQRAWELIEFEENYIEPCFLAMGQNPEGAAVDDIYIHVRDHSRRNGRGLRINEFRMWLRRKFGLRYNDYLQAAQAEGLVRIGSFRNKHGPASMQVYDPKILIPPDKAQGRETWTWTALGESMREEAEAIRDERTLEAQRTQENLTRAKTAPSVPPPPITREIETDG